MRALPVLASQMNKARWIIDRYKQTLAEIKEFVKNEMAQNGDTYIILQKISEVDNANIQP